jgi:hypothetical protein
MDMRLNLVAFLAGIILLFVAILGGGFELKELKIPRVSWFPRLMSAFVGALFVVVGIGMEPLPPNSPHATPAPSVQASPPVNTPREQELSEQLTRERQSREQAEQELTKLKSERQQAETVIQNEVGASADATLVQLLNQIERSKATQQNDGLYGVVKVTWLDLPQFGFVIMNGNYGLLRTSYQDSTGTVEVVDQDLNLFSDQNQPYLVGSNPRFANTTTPHPQYSPDVFRLQLNSDSNLYYLDAVCDARLTCSRIETQSLF